METDNSNAEPAESSALPDLSRRALGGGFAALVASLTGAGVANAADGAVKTYKPVMTGTDFATTDPAYYDPYYPPTHFPHVFMSGGVPIQSFMWIADGPEAKGCVIFSPQRNGGDHLDSLIPALVASGIHVLRFNPRGMWDDKQKYSFVHALEDIHAAVAHLRENGGQHAVPPGAGTQRPYRIDLDKVAVLGKSGGGGMLGWIANSENPGINANIAVSPAFLLKYPLTPEFTKMFNDLKTSTAGRLDILQEVKDVPEKEFGRFDMLKASSKLIDKNVLLIGHNSRAHIDTIHRPLLTAMDNAGAKRFSQVVLEGDSYFLTARIAMTRLVISWLKSECGF